MIKFACSIPHDCYLAFSGGSDSSMLLHFLLSNPKRKVKLVYVVYNDYINKDDELKFVESVAKKHSLDLIIHNAESNPGNLTMEQHWSIQRNIFFNILDKPVLTGHNLDDALEWYLMTVIKGDMNGKQMPIINRNVMRPLLFTKKSNIISYIDRHEIEYFYDSTNGDTSITRNEVRHNIIPSLVKISPGIYNSLINKY